MSRKSLITLGMAVVAAFLISACGTPMQSQGEKIAFIDYAKVVKTHPEKHDLDMGELILKDLVQRRQLQEWMAMEQLNSLSKLRELTSISQQSYWSAELNTRMVEIQATENAKLQNIAAKIEVEADKKIADRKKAVEEAYRLEIFNLRVQLESVKLNPELREQIHLKLVRAKDAREKELSELRAEKNGYIEAAMKPHIDAAKKRIADYAAQQTSDINKKLSGSAASQEEKLKAAPDALHKALFIMDKEIEKQRMANDELKSKIDKDITSVSTKLAHEQGYTIIFKDVKANVKAADITEAVINELKKTQNNSK